MPQQRRRDQRDPEPQPRNQPGFGQHSDIIRLALRFAPGRAPAREISPTAVIHWRDPFAKTAQRLRNSSATPPSMPRSRRPVCSFAWLRWPLVALATSATARAEAEDSAAVEKVTKLNKKAVDEYQNLNFEESRKVLKAAIEICAPVGAGEPPGHRAHLRPPRHRHVHGLQAEGRGDQAVPQGAGDPGRHQAGQDPGDAGGPGGLRRGGRRAEEAAAEPKKPATEAGRGHRAHAGDAIAAGRPRSRSRRPSIPAWARRRSCCRSAPTAPTTSPSRDEGGPGRAAAATSREIPASATQGGVGRLLHRGARRSRQAGGGQGLREQDAEDHDAGPNGQPLVQV